MNNVATKPAATNLYSEIAAAREESGVRGPHFRLNRAGRTVTVFALQDDQGIECLYAGDRKIVAEVYPDGSIEYANGWERYAS